MLGHFPILEESYLSIPRQDISCNEIWKSIKRLGAYKAPSPDGFQAIFFHSQWPTVGDSICKLIKDIWENPWKIKEINSTHIALILKVDNISTMKQFRLIGLCNVTYKAITKIITNMIRGGLSCIVGPA